MLSVRRSHLALWAIVGLSVFASVGQAVEPRLLPANTEIVINLNIKQILASELVQSQQDLLKQMKDALDNLPDNGETAKYLKLMGFDPFTDLRAVTVALPGGMDRKGPKEFFIVIDGVFDAKKLTAAAESAAENYPGVVRITKNGATPVYEIQVPNETLYGALVGGKSLVLTNQEEALKGAITRAAGTTIAAVKVKNLLKTINDRQSYSLVIAGDTVNRLTKRALDAGSDIPGLGDALGSIQGITAAVTIAKGVNFQLSIGTEDEKNARELAEMGETLMKLANFVLKAKDDPNLDVVIDILKTVRISAVNSNAVLTGSVSQEILEKMIKMKLERGGN
jgi:hypothetical protein